MTTVTTADGLKLHLQRWPATGRALGTVQLVHGLGEHIGRYAELAAALNAAGWAVAGHDHRGHGRSEGARGALPSPHAMLDDLARVADALRAPGMHVLLGHSLGGLLAARFVAEQLQPRPQPWAREVDGLVLSSPALQLDMTPGQKRLLKVLAPLAGNLAVNNGLQPAWISRNPEVVRRYKEDPLVHDRVTPRLVRFIVNEGAFVRTLAPQWTTPTLLLWAGSDRCVAPAGSAAFAAAAPGAVVTSQVFPALFHEIFNEPERRLVTGQVVRWLQKL